MVLADLGGLGRLTAGSGQFLGALGLVFRGLDLSQHLVAGAESQQLSLFQQHEFVHVGEQTHAMGNQHKGAALLFAGGDSRSQGMLTLVIEIGVRFVQHDQFRLTHKSLY